MNIYKIRHALKLAYTAFRHYKYKFIILIVLGFTAGTVGSIGIGAIIPLFSFVVNKNGLGIDFISKLLQKIFFIFHVPYNLPFLLLFMVFLFLTKAVTTFLASYLNVAQFAITKENIC